MKRVQTSLWTEDYKRIEKEAKKRRVPIALVVREYVEKGLKRK